jgi:Ulp1 family protease
MLVYIHLRSKRIYIMNSYVTNEVWVVNSLIALSQGLYGGTWKCVTLKCPIQYDTVNCGIFAVMNIAYVVQAVEIFDNMDILTNDSRNSSWGKTNLPIELIRSQLADCIVNRQLDISQILKHVNIL